MRHWKYFRLIAVPVYVGLLSILGVAGIVFRTNGPFFEVWWTFLQESLSTWAPIPFVLGNAAVFWFAAGRAREGNLKGAAELGFGGTLATFFLSAFLLPEPSGWFFSDPGFRVLLVFTVGWPGLLAGALLPAAWGQFEARSSNEGTVAEG